jgi:hypothetical protein
MFRQKLTALALFIITAFCIIMKEPAIALFTAPAGLILMFSKYNWLYY